MSDEQQTSGADLFNAPSAGGGGAFWQPEKPGTYLVKFTGVSAGPVFEREVTDKATGETHKEPNPQVRWAFEVYRLSNRKRVTFVPEDGAEAGQTLEATSDALTSKTFSARSNAGKFIEALCGPQDWAVLSSEGKAGVARLLEEAVGRFAVASFAKGKMSDRIKISELSPVDDEDEETDDDD